MLHSHKVLIWILIIVIAIVWGVSIALRALEQRSGTGNVEDTSGIAGTILRGPTCPVMREPPDPDCADQPVPNATFIVTNIAGTREYRRFETNENGTFSITLAPGEYAVKPQKPVGIGIQSYRIEIKEGEMTETTITFDTGIR